MRGKPAAGFTLLEVMLVMLLLGGVAALVVATLPAQDTREQLQKLSLTLSQAATQAATDGQMLQLTIHHHGWQLCHLQPGESAHQAFLPGHHWQPLSGKLSHWRLPAGVKLRLYIQGKEHRLPASLLFLPDNDMPAVTFGLQTEQGETRYISWRNGQIQEEGP